jgi:pyruvate kinase
MEFSSDPEETIRNAMKMLKKTGWVDQGSWLVVITNALAHDQIIDTLQLRQIDES